MLFLAGYVFIIHRFIRRGQKKELAIVLAVCAAGITEQFLFNLSFKNLTFFFLGDLMFELLAPKKRENSVWCQERALISFNGYVGYQRNLAECFLTGVFKIWKQKKVLAASFVVGTIAALACTFGIQMPESVYVNGADRISQ